MLTCDRLFRYLRRTVKPCAPFVPIYCKKLHRGGVSPDDVAVMWKRQDSSLRLCFHVRHSPYYFGIWWMVRPEYARVRTQLAVRAAYFCTIDRETLTGHRIPSCATCDQGVTPSSLRFIRPFTIMRRTIEGSDQ